MKLEKLCIGFIFLFLLDFNVTTGNEWENIDASFETETEQKDDITGACTTDKDCKAGYCKVKDGVGSCICVRGIKGDNCNIIKECDENKDLCGTDPKAQCTFDYKFKKAYCKCKIRSKRFDVETKTCVDQEPCDKSLKQCKNEGYCAKNREFESDEDESENANTTYCQCPLGTSGDFCERVEECVKKPNYCGDGTDVECRMNSHINRIYCQCLDQEQRFDWKLKKCVDRKKCRYDDECLPFGRCADKCQSYEPCISYRNIEKKASCHCVEGTSGHKCEVIDDCYNKVVDCGNDGTTICTYYYNEGLSAHAYCKCSNQTLKYDDSEKTCKECDCGPMGAGCDFKKGKQVCKCKEGSFNFGDRCQDCECGEGSTGCTFSGMNKSCFCKPGYLEVNGFCERCDCGADSSECKFDEKGEKICTCESGFKTGNYGVCTPMCSDKKKCSNGGLCLQDICVCLAGTGGPYCETVYECENNDLCGDEKGVLKPTCKYDIKTQKAYCDCGSWIYFFDSVEKICKACACSDGRCEVRLGQKFCHCYKDFSYNPVSTKCERCECNSGNCSFDSNGEKICKCKDGFLPYNGDCRECDCGRNGLCRHMKRPDTWYYPAKICTCDAGYAELEGTCSKCDCGLHGSCKFQKISYQRPVKVCSCAAGYEEHNGTCLKCDCSPNGKCSFNDLGDTIKCECDPGFQETNGKCKLCDCGPYSSGCYFKNNTSSLQKICDCSKGFIENKGYCQDYNECFDGRACSGSGTICENTIGSFICRCLPGYNPQSDKAPLFNNALLCLKEEQPNYKTWKIAVAVLSGVFLTIIIGLLIALMKKRRN